MEDQKSSILRIPDATAWIFHAYAFGTVGFADDSLSNVPPSLELFPTIRNSEARSGPTKHTSRGNISLNALVLDSAASLHLFANASMLQNIRSATKPTPIHCGGKSWFNNQVGDLCDDLKSLPLPQDELHLHEDGVANLVSLALLSKSHRIFLDSRIDNAFYVYKDNGEYIRFQLEPNGLYCLHVDDGSSPTTLLTTVEEEKKMFSALDVKRAALAMHDNATSGSIHTNATYYKHVGIFRSDVFYITPIKVNDAVAVIPSFHSNFGYCDRLFIGEYKYARIWASKRFDFIPIFENQYMDIKNGYHSETLLKNMLNHYKVPVVKEQICFMRVRAGPRIMKGDCGEYPEFKTLEQRNKILSQHVDSASSTITIKDISTVTTSTTKSKTATTTINDSSSLSSEDDVDDDNDDAPCVDKTGTFKVKGISGNKLTCKKVKKKNKCNEKGENGKKLSELCPIRCKTFCDDDDNDNDNTALGDNTASEESNNNVATINSRERLPV